MVEERRETREGEERRGERRSRANRALREGVGVERIELCEKEKKRS
tara:strand:- start:225 stop:362 length:138 start_codon:yes stop_codon:yes gene_type:complete